MRRRQARVNLATGGDRKNRTANATLRRGEKRWRDGYGLARVTETHAPDPGRDEFRVRYKNLGVTDSAWGGTAVLDELQAGI